MAGTTTRQLAFGGSPWARAAMDADPGRTAILQQLAAYAGANVSATGKSASGPWVVNVTGQGRQLRFAGPHLHDVISFGLERFAAKADDRAVRWLAGTDELEHGHVGRIPRTLCNRPAVPEQMAHPGRARCNECWRTLDGLAA